MSPAGFNNSSAGMFYMRDTGIIYNTNNQTTQEYGIRPVINLSSTVEVVAGDGTVDD